MLCVDGVHGFAAVDVDLPDFGCDFLATGTHKWLKDPNLPDWKFPFRSGDSAAGRVLKVGKDFPGGFQEGDRVISVGPEEGEDELAALTRAPVPAQG